MGQLLSTAPAQSKSAAASASPSSGPLLDASKTDTPPTTPVAKEDKAEEEKKVEESPGIRDIKQKLKVSRFMSTCIVFCRVENFTKKFR